MSPGPVIHWCSIRRVVIVIADGSSEHRSTSGSRRGANCRRHPAPSATVIGRIRIVLIGLLVLRWSLLILLRLVRRCNRGVLRNLHGPLRLSPACLQRLNRLAEIYSLALFV